MTKQYGSAGRDQYNVGRDVHIHGIPTRSDRGSGSQGTGEDAGDNGRNAKAGAGFLVVLAVIVVIAINSASSGGSAPTLPFPSRSSPWPPGATASSVIAPVVSRLQACAQAPVLSPVHCPQSQSDDYSDITDVRWSLHGDAADGARIVYSKNKFYVAGNAIMVVTYSDAGGDNLAMNIVHYRANVLWQGGHATLTKIEGVSTASGPVVVKQRPNVTWSQVQAAVALAFGNCAKQRSAPLPPQCPTEQDSSFSGSKPRWRLTSNPVLNAQESFDRASGLIHVTGSFAMSATYNVMLLGKQHDSEAGNYDAALSVDGAKIDVLQISAN